MGSGIFLYNRRIYSCWHTAFEASIFSSHVRFLYIGGEAEFEKDVIKEEGKGAIC
jgi:hypothetical protein